MRPESAVGDRRAHAGIVRVAVVALTCTLLLAASLIDPRPGRAQGGAQYPIIFVHGFLGSKFHCQAEPWETPQNLTFYDSSDYALSDFEQMVDVEVDPDGNAIAVWLEREDGEPARIVSATRAAGATGFSGREVLHSHEIFVFRPQLAMDLNGNAVATWTNGFQTWAAYRPAGGSFSSAEQLSDVPPEHVGTNFPEAAMDSQGNAIVAWGYTKSLDFDDFSNSESTIEAAYRPAGAASSFGQAQRLRPFAPVFAGVPKVTIKDGKAVVAWTEFSPQVARAAYSSGGGSFGAPVDVSRGGFRPQSLIENDKAVFVWQQRPGGIKTATADFGEAPGPATALSSADATPFLATSEGGDAVVVWDDGDDLGTSFRAALGSFDAPRLVESNGVANPTAAFGPNGDVRAVWQKDEVPASTYIHSAFRPAGGTFGEAETLATSAGAQLSYPSTDLFPNGDAIGVWTRMTGKPPSAGEVKRSYDIEYSIRPRVTPRRELWPNIPPGPSFQNMRLAPDGVSNRDDGNECTATAEHDGLLLNVEVGPITEDIYQSTRDFVTRIAGDHAYFYTYDWRKSPELALASLDDTIDQAMAETGKSKVVLMAHSMGGLVTRAYIDDATSAAKVARSVTIGTPYWGAAKVWFPLAHGFESPSFSGMDLFIDNSDMMALSKDLAGLFALFPSRQYYDLLASTTNITDRYAGQGGWLAIEGRNGNDMLDVDGTLQAISERGGNRSLAQEALDFHRDHLDGFETNGVEVIAVIGVGVPTIFRVIEEPGTISDSLDYQYWDGDGTVPHFSARQSDFGQPPLGEDIPRYHTCDIGHVPLPGHPAVTARIEQWLLTGAPVVGTENDCPSTGWEVMIMRLREVASARRVTARSTAQGAGDDPLSLMQAEAEGLLDVIGDPGDVSTLVVDSSAPLELDVPAGTAVVATRLVDSGEGAPLFFDALDSSGTVSVGEELTVASGGEEVAPAAPDTAPPKTTIASARKSGSNAVLTKKATDASGVLATYWRIGTGPVKTWTGSIKVKLSRLRKLRFGSVDIYGNVEAARKVPRSILRRLT